MTTVDQAAPASAEEVNGEAAGWWRRWRWPLMIGGPIVILAVVAYFLLTGGRSEATDDAYVEAAKAPISAAIAGRVIEVDVVENQHVKAGQVLFKLDPADERAQALRAQAAVAAARVQLAALRAAYDQQTVNLAAAQQTQTYALREAGRQRALVGAGVSSRQQGDEASHNAQLATAQVDLARQGVVAALANLGGAARTPDAYPAVLQAQANLQAMNIALADTVVVAPQDGVVTKVDQLQTGAYVNAAQTVFWLLSGEPWIEANFKENQLRKMRVGEPAQIKIDAFAGALAGHVASFSPGSGSTFSALPAQNATGNWVKVVQRLPVRIAFDKPPPEMVSRAGLSATVTVDVRGGKAPPAAR